MDQNPYQSPTAELTNPADLLPSEQRLGRRRPSLMAAIGVFVGGGTAAVCGGIGGSLLALAHFLGLAPFLGGEPDRLGDVFGGGLMGVISGGLIGIPIGAIAGLASGISIDFRSRMPVYVAATLSALGGGLVGTIGGSLIGFDFSTPNRYWLVGGGLIGVLAGIGGGTFMGIMLQRINHRLRPYADGLEQTIVIHDQQ